MKAELKVISVEQIIKIRIHALAAKGTYGFNERTAGRGSLKLLLNSHLFQKCQQLLIACRLHSSSADTRSELVALCEYDLKGAHFSETKQEYEELQWALREHGLMGAQRVRLQRLGLQAGEPRWRTLAGA